MKNIMKNLASFAGINVMIVDDADENILIMEHIFQTLECNIKTANSGNKAIDIYKNGFKPDIVSMDLIMPVKDGAKTTKELKELGCKAHFIAVSGLKDYPSDVKELFDSYLLKPFTIEEMMNALSSYESKRDDS